MLKEVDWEITNECNLTCKHCLPMSGTPRTHELTTEEVFHALQTFKEHGVEKVCFTGGEPFCKNDLIPILEFATRIGVHTSVITNGTLIGERTLLKMKALQVDLAVSLEASCKEKNDFIRGKGTFDKVITFLKLCCTHGVSLDLYMTVNNQNIGEVKKVGNLAKKYKCRGFHIKEINKDGRAGQAPFLWIDESNRTQLAHVTTSVIEDVFCESVSYTDSHCWADGTALFVSADGNIYPCVEVFYKRPELALGNVRSSSLDQILEYVSSEKNCELSCPYMVKGSESVTAMLNVPLSCHLAPEIDEPIENLTALYRELDNLYKTIDFYCRSCAFPACMGNMWLLEEEAAALYDVGVPIIEINEDVELIHLYEENPDGSVHVSLDHPLCIEFDQDTRTCSIYENRPLLCRFYPVGLETTEQGDIVWAFHRDCLFYRELERGGLVDTFVARANTLIDSIDGILKERIIEKYRRIHRLYTFPHGENDYMVMQYAEPGKSESKE